MWWIWVLVLDLSGTDVNHHGCRIHNGSYTDTGQPPEQWLCLAACTAGLDMGVGRKWLRHGILLCSIDMYILINIILCLAFLVQLCVGFGYGRVCNRDCYSC